MPLSRRAFLGTTLAGTLLAEQGFAAVPADSRQATGVKIGEVDATSARVWQRLTAAATHHAQGKLLPRGRTVILPDDAPMEELRGACPGQPGEMRFRHGVREDLSDAQVTPWREVAAAGDFTQHLFLENLKPATRYFYASDSRGRDGKEHASLRGQFQTAPLGDSDVDVHFTIATCTGYKDLDHADGYHIFPAMTALAPMFWVHSGDNIYLDNDDFTANTITKARHHWHRMHGLPRQVEFNLRFPGYWEKDDHDTLADDCWPGAVNKKMLPLTFPQGQALYREQVPIGERNYRTFRWGRGVQIWLTEGRDFRSPNTMADGPDKSIWGKEQKEWLMRTLSESRAEYKILISPTPLVGPDRPNKRDNHANASFQTEGNEFRRWAQKHLDRRFFTVCGDRHWQYHSVHPETGLHEYACGAASDEHAGGTPGLDKAYHRYHRVQGGFLSIRYSAEKKSLVVRHHDVHGKVSYEHTV